MTATGATTDATPREGRPAPRLKGYPVVGMLPGLLFHPGEVLLRLAREHAGQVVAVNLGMTDVYFVTHPRHVRHVFRTNWKNYPKGELFWVQARRLVGEGLFLSTGEVWVRSRRLLQPVFSARGMAGLAEAMAPILEEEMERLGPLARAGTTVDMATEALRITQRVSLGLMFGASLLPEQEAELAEAVPTALTLLGRRMFLDFLPGWMPIPGERALRRAIATIDRFVLGAIAERRRAAAAGVDLLGLLTGVRDEEGRPALDDQQLRDEVITMFLASNETTATALSWTWHLLDRHEAAAARLDAELDAVLGGRRPGYPDLGQLAYTRQVAQEALRMYPPAWILPRVAAEDDVIDDYAVPRGAQVVVSPYLCHHDPSLWERPDEFDPDRFSAARFTAEQQGAFLPFGEGPRRCIGEHLALMELQMLIAMTRQRYRLRGVAGRAVAPHFTLALRVRGGLPMTIERR